MSFPGEHVGAGLRARPYKNAARSLLRKDTGHEHGMKCQLSMSRNSNSHFIFFKKEIVRGRAQRPAP
jgi:hypothetical protein